MNTAAAQPAARSADLAAWIAVGAASLGSFMATLDISIVNTSLPTIQGEIGASGTEGTWVGTSYLVAESIAIPLAAWLTRLLGLRRLMLGAIASFTLFSIICGLAHDLTTMIIGRTAQGLTGGLLLPTVMTIIADRLPDRQQPMGFAILGVAAITGPLIGPVLGGWLTDTLSWHYGFFINLPIGIVLLPLLMIALPRQAGHLENLLEADWLGIAGLAIGLGCLTVVLEEGQRELWFQSSEIVWLTVASAMGFLLLAIGQFVAPSPVIRLSLLREWRFATTVLLTATVGMSFYGTSFAIPQFLATIGHYNAFQSGEVLLFGGVMPLILVPFGPLLVRRLDTRLAVGFGMSMMALSSWLDASVSPEAGAAAFIGTQLIRGTGICFTIVFLTQLSMSLVPPEYVADASGLVNGSRNLGGSLALAGLATIQDQRFWLHSRRLEETLAANSGTVQDYLNGFAHLGGGPAEGMRLLAATIDRQALVMTYDDLFWLLAIGIILVTPLALLLPQFPKTPFRPTH